MKKSDIIVSLFALMDLHFFTLLTLNLPFFKDTVDPDQLALIKPSDLDPHCFPL